MSASYFPYMVDWERFQAAWTAHATPVSERGGDDVMQVFEG